MSEFTYTSLGWSRNTESEKEAILAEVSGEVPLDCLASLVLSELAGEGRDIMDAEWGIFPMVSDRQNEIPVAAEDGPIPTAELFGAEDTGEIRKDALYECLREECVTRVERVLRAATEDLVDALIHSARE